MYSVIIADCKDVQPGDNDVTADRHDVGNDIIADCNNVQLWIMASLLTVMICSYG